MNIKSPIIKIGSINNHYKALPKSRILKKTYSKSGVDLQRLHLLNKWIADIKTVYPIISKMHFIDNHTEHMNKYITLVTKLVENRGAKEAINMLKKYKLIVQQVCLKQTISTIPFCKTDKDGFPKVLKPWKPDVSSLNSMRYCNSVMRIPEVFTLPVDTDTSTITDPSSAKAEVVNDIITFIEKWKGIKALKPLSKVKIIMSNKAGPNGPATFTCLRDLCALREEPKLLEAIRSLLKQSSPYLKDINYKTPSEKAYRHSKISFLPDKFGKTRIIGICDWWTNMGLKSIHNAFMDALGKLPGDVTFRQNKVPKLIKRLGRNLYSSDMTAFTDRFPIEILESVVKTAYGSEISQLWKTLLTDRYFSVGKDQHIKYEVGNPMGVLSSWAVSTFAHHALKAYCVSEVYSKVKNRRLRRRLINKYKYLILGDDTVDSNPKVYSKYIQTIKNLGVSISENKCTVSKDAYCEFAKRLFTPLGEITGIPVSLCLEFRTKPEQIIEFVRIVAERGYQSDTLARAVFNILESGLIKDPKLISDVLSLQSWEEAPDLQSKFKGNLSISEEAKAFLETSEDVQSIHLDISRNYVFWKITSQQLQGPNLEAIAEHLQSVECFTPSHPLVLGLHENIESYLPEESYDESGEENETFIYDQWLKGNYRHLANLPTIDTYRYYNKGHKVTKCKFEVYKALYKLIKGDTSIPLVKHMVITNYELHETAFRSLQSVLKVSKK